MSDRPGPHPAAPFIGILCATVLGLALWFVGWLVWVAIGPRDLAVMAVGALAVLACRWVGRHG